LVRQRSFLPWKKGLTSRQSQRRDWGLLGRFSGERNSVVICAAWLISDVSQEMKALAPSTITIAALRVLHIAAFTTRNWTLPGSSVTLRQINDLWEAIHEVPDVLTRWDNSKEREEEIERYFREYDAKWGAPALLAIYHQARDEKKG
jgi:hypothetical protein